MAEALLAVEGLCVSFAGVPAVRDVSFDVHPGEIVGLIGPNGAGKSTTLNAILGVCSADAGDVRLAGTSILGRKPEAIARDGVSLVPEGRRIYANFTVAENLRLGLVGRRDRDRERIDTDLAWIHELFPMLDEFRMRPAGALSGGQQQQLAIARALAAGPRVLLLDEPSLGLAPKLVDVVFEALTKIRDRGVAVLLVEQRAQRTVALAERTFVLANGMVRMTLGPADADDMDRLVSAYLA
jgi:branched-chain amino acid transport system ATP-binding protein